MNYKNLISSFLFLFILASSVHAQKISEYTPTDISDINSKEYGQGTSIGLNILGDGLGLILRKTFDKEDQIGLGSSMFLQPILNSAGDEIERIAPGLFLRSEYNFFMGNTYKEKAKRTKVKQKYRKHYISVKPGIGLSSTNIYSLAFTWHRETFKLKNKKHARGLDLGLVYNFVQDTSDNITTPVVGIYLRLDWTWFR